MSRVGSMRTRRACGLSNTGDALFPSEIFAANLRHERQRSHLTQDQLALAMRALGFRWGRATVGAIESEARSATVDELFGLAVCLDVTLAQLLLPCDCDGAGCFFPLVDFGNGQVVRIEPYCARARCAAERAS